MWKKIKFKLISLITEEVRKEIYSIKNTLQKVIADAEDSLDEYKITNAKALFNSSNKPKFKVGDSIGIYKVLEIKTAHDYPSSGKDYKDYHFSYVLIDPEKSDGRVLDEDELYLLKS